MEEVAGPIAQIATSQDSRRWTYLISRYDGALNRIIYEALIGEQARRFAHPIDKRIETDTLVVLQLSKGHGAPDRNIIAFEHDGSKAWEIEPIENPVGSGNDIYRDIELDDGTIVATSFQGCVVTVDPKDGTITKERWVK